MAIKTKYSFILLLLLASTVFAYGQLFKTDTGSLESISGVVRYNIIFEYADDLKIPRYVSENAFLEAHSKKMNKKEGGSGESFKVKWISSRAEIFEPKFIQEFNFFNLKEKQVTVAPNISAADYTMVVRTTSIDPGRSNFFFKKDARLRVYIRIYKTDHPEQVMYATEAIEVHSKGANSDILDRIMSAYSELGRGFSKHLSRKT